MKTHVMMFAVSVCLLSTVSSADELSCGDVYAKAVRDISTTTRKSAAETYIYSQHCEANGELRSESAGLDLTIPLKKIDLSFSGTMSEARQKMVSFCRIHHQSNNATSETWQYENTVVVDALAAFNDCRVLEANGVKVRHQEVEPQSLIIDVSFNPATTSVHLRGVAYNTDAGTCSTTGIDKDGLPTNVDAATAEKKIERPFSIRCDRIAEETAKHGKKFPRFAVGVDLNHGIYSVALPAEEMLGYDLANANRVREIALLNKISELERQLENDALPISSSSAYKIKNGPNEHPIVFASIVDPAKKTLTVNVGFRDSITDSCHFSMASADSVVGCSKPIGKASNPFHFQGDLRWYRDRGYIAFQGFGLIVNVGEVHFENSPVLSTK